MRPPSSTADVSLRTQKKADAVTKSNPDLAKQVAAGDVSLNEAYATVKGGTSDATSAQPKLDGKVKTPNLTIEQRLRKKVADLEGELAQAREDVQRACEGAIERDELLVAFQAFEANEHVEKITTLQRQLRDTEIQRDTITRQSEQMRREIRRLHAIESKFIKLIKGGGVTTEDLARIALPMPVAEGAT